MGLDVFTPSQILIKHGEVVGDDQVKFCTCPRPSFVCGGLHIALPRSLIEFTSAPVRLFFEVLAQYATLAAKMAVPQASPRPTRRSFEVSRRTLPRREGFAVPSGSIRRSICVPEWAHPGRYEQMLAARQAPVEQDCGERPGWERSGRSRYFSVLPSRRLERLGRSLPAAEGTSQSTRFDGRSNQASRAAADGGDPGRGPYNLNGRLLHRTRSQGRIFPALKDGRLRSQF